MNALLPLLLAVGKYILASAALYLFYRFLFRQKASFRESRLFLASITLIAVLISQFRIEVTHPAPTYVEVESPTALVVQVGGIPAVLAASDGKAVVAQDSPSNTVSTQAPKSKKLESKASGFLTTSITYLKDHPTVLLFWLYLLVVLFQFANLGLQYLSIRKLKRQGKNERREGFTLVRHAGIATPFSAGKTVFLPNNLSESQLEVVLHHERWHIAHRHYLDVFVQECLTCLFWFNPIQWLLRKELRSIHEFETDRSVLDEGTDLYRYQTIILEEVMGNHFRLANGFNQSFTKKRFIQMKNTRNQQLATGHKLLVVPILTLLFAALCFVPGQSQVVKVEKTTKRINGTPVTTTTTSTVMDSVRIQPIALDPNNIQASYLKSLDSMQQMVNNTLPVARKLAASSNPASNAADMNKLLVAMNISANGQGINYSDFSQEFIKSLSRDDFKQLQKILENTNDSLRLYRAQKVDRMDSPYLIRPVALAKEMMSSSFVSKLFPELFKVMGKQMAGMMQGMASNGETANDSERLSSDASNVGKMMGEMMGQLTKNLGQMVQGLTNTVQTKEVVCDTVPVSTPEDDISEQTLIKIALNDPSREVRYTALQQIEDQAVLLQIAKNDKDLPLRAEAVRRLKDTKMLSNLAQTDPEPRIRVAALDRLNQLKKKQ